MGPNTTQRVNLYSLNRRRPLFHSLIWFSISLVIAREIRKVASKVYGSQIEFTDNYHAINERLFFVLNRPFTKQHRVFKWSLLPKDRLKTRYCLVNLE